ncbi:hypothetical protein TraAM80_03258 [Trypanosoma rangeli]|uniref:Fibronectin type-III domain-containing protein n=1 Tax=Trypanosoma rangeli TaxID=5698 RepID=A0A3R7MKP7_TRYRA|nr:uncharacterized protein TraAM80_03258 [Trypanosoma rangeli]RNF07575.1 hypothetical protein TraAM80_03258 [Trypanosoma rangeli]|eukprot:RNF07575.1 hypothetical protein TraAM80_03258 [Trypanosoma rangeli]
MTYLGDDICAGGIIDCLYTLYAGSTGGGVFMDLTVSHPPTLVVVTFGKPPVSSAVVLEAAYDDEASFIMNLMRTYPFSKFMLVTYAEEATLASGQASVGTPSMEWVQKLPPKFCCVHLSSFQRHVVCAPAVCEVNPDWIRELQGMSQSLHTPQELVVSLFLRIGLRIKLTTLCHLSAEGHWMGNENLVAALLERMAAWADKEAQTSFTDVSSVVDGTLQVRCRAHFERVNHMVPHHSMLELGFRIKSLVSHRDAEGDAGGGGGAEMNTLANQLTSRKPPIWLLVLHACGSGRTRRSLEEVTWLLENLTLNDVVFVSLAGDVVVQPSHAPEAIRQWEVNKDDARQRRKKHRPPLQLAMVSMWKQARTVLRHWRYERHCRLVRGESAADCRIAIVFFAPSHGGSSEELSLSSVRRGPAFYRVPVFCVVTPERVKKVRVLMDLCLLTQGRLLYTTGDVADFDANIPSEGACKSVIQTTLQLIRDISHLNAAFFFVAGHSSGRPVELLTTSTTFGEAFAALLRSDSLTGGRTGKYLLLGPLQNESEIPVYISQRLSETLDMADTRLRMMVCAYTIDGGDYEVVPLRSLGGLKGTTQPERVWWTRLRFVSALLDEMQPRRMCPTIKSKHLLEGDAEGWNGAYAMSDTHLTNRGGRCGLLLASWILSECSAQPIRGLEHAVLASFASSSHELSSVVLWRENEGWWAVPPAAPCSARLTPRPLVNLSWTNFSVHGTYASSVAAILSRTFPFNPMKQQLSSLASSTTLALESIQYNNAVIRLASAEHVPVLKEATERYIVLSTVDLATETMTMRQVIPATSPSDVVRSIAHEFKNLALKQIYCVVHLALRRAPALWVSQEDLMVADGIAFSTPFARVESVNVIAVSHDRAEVEWSGTARTVQLTCRPISEHESRSKNAVLYVYSEDGERVTSGVNVVSHHVITELNPCTIYSLEVRPVELGEDRSMVKSFLWSEGVELYFATCVEHKRSMLRLNAAIPSESGVTLTFSYPIYSEVVVLSSSAALGLRVTPTITPLNAPDDAQLVKTEDGEGNEHVVTFYAKGLGTLLLHIAFDVDIRPTFWQGRNKCRRMSWSRRAMAPQTEEMGPFEVVSGVCCAAIHARSVALAWEGISFLFIVCLTTCNSHGEEVSVCEWVVSGLGSLCITLDALVPCTRYTARVRTANNAETGSVEFYTPPDAPSQEVVTATSNMASLLLRVQLRAKDEGNEFISVRLIPKAPFFSNADGTSGVAVESYAQVPVCQPVVLGIEANWRVNSTEILCSEPTLLFAVTDLRCVRETDGCVTMVWTCAAERHGSPLTVSIDEESFVVRTCNKLRIEPPSSTPVRVLFHGPAIIQEVTPIFLIPGPPPLNFFNCTVGAPVGNAMEVCIATDFLVLLRRLFADVMEQLRVFLNVAATETAESKQYELPLKEYDEDDVVVQVSVPKSSEHRAVVLRVQLRESDDDDGNALLRSITDEAALCSRPTLLIPKPFSEAFTVPITLPARIKELRVMALLPTSVTLAWAPPEGVGSYAADCAEVCATVRCVVQENHRWECRLPVPLPTRSVSVGGLFPATPYHVAVRGCDDDEGESVCIVTPHEFTDDALSDLLLSVEASLAGSDSEGALPVCLHSGRMMTEALTLQMTLPPAKCTCWTIPAHSAWLAEETGECGEISSCLCVRASLHVAVTAESGESMQLWSTAGKSQALSVFHTFPIVQDALVALLPRLEMKWASDVQYMPRRQEEDSGDAATCVEAANTVVETALTRRNTTPAPTSADTVQSIVTRTTTVGTMSVSLPPDRRIVVDVVGCTRLQSMDKDHCTVEWDGSCNLYTVHWRVAPAGAIHTATVMRQPGGRPQFTVDLRLLSFTVLMFCVHGAEGVSNCALFTVVVPLTATGPQLYSHNKEEAAERQIPVGLSSELVGVVWPAEMGDRLPDGWKDVVCSLSVTDRSNSVWVAGFTEMMGNRFGGRSPNPSSIKWLDPVVSIPTLMA